MKRPVFNLVLNSFFMVMNSITCWNKTKIITSFLQKPETMYIHFKKQSHKYRCSRFLLYSVNLIKKGSFIPDDLVNTGSQIVLEPGEVVLWVLVVPGARSELGRREKYLFGNRFALLVLHYRYIFIKSHEKVAYKYLLS